MAYEPTVEDLARYTAQVNVLSPSGEEFGLSKIRALNPRIGWNEITAIMNQLVENGVVEKRVIVNGKARYELYKKVSA